MCNRIVPPEEAPDVLNSKVLPIKKRPLNEEEADKEDMQDKKKKKKTETSDSITTNTQPKWLMKKFTFFKNEAWGSTWKEYFHNYFVEIKSKAKINMKKKTKKMNMKRVLPEITKKPLAEKYKERVIGMGGSEPVLVIEKMIYTSDVISKLNRFSIPFRQIISRDFLTEEEKLALLKREELIVVSMMDPCYREWTLTMRQWNMNSDVYVLNSDNWQDFVKANALKPGMKVQLWSFRVGGRLCFLLVRLDDSH